MSTVTITVPDHSRAEDIAEYVRDVAALIEDGCLSGHVSAERHWTTEGWIIR